MTALPHESTRGFGLTECLLAVGLFSFGLLGSGALITERLRESRAAHSYFLAEMLGQDLAARIEANPKAAGGSGLRDWQTQAQDLLPDLICTVTPMGGSPPAYRLDLRWIPGPGDSGQLMIWLGR